MAQSLTASPLASSGADLALSRQVQGLAVGSAWLVPGDGSICFVFTDEPVGGGETCQPDTVVTEGQLVMTSGGDAVPGTTLVAGVVPDGVSQVTLSLANGGTVSVPVAENVYIATETQSVTSVTFTGPDGPVTDSVS
jgi:hypothetical protein